MSISTHHEILIKRLSSFVHQIDIALRAALVTKMQLPDFRTNMRAGYLQPGDVTDPGSRPVTEREDCSSTPVSPLHDQRAQYRALRTLHEDGNSLSERQVGKMLRKRGVLKEREARQARKSALQDFGWER